MTDSFSFRGSLFPVVCLAMASLFSFSTSGLADEWSTDADASVKLAENESKDLLLLYTGSDWCPPCIKLEENVLGKDNFQTDAKADFILVKFDFPQTKQLSDDLKEQNAKWQDKYGITAYPTLVLVDSKLKPYAFTGSRDESAEEYLAHLVELKKIRIQRDELFEQAAKAEGVEKAQLLDQALSLMTTEIAEFYYDDMIETIVELDKDDSAGLRTKYYAAKEKELRKELLTDIAIASRLRAPQDAIEYIDVKMKEMELPADMRLQAYGFKLQMLRKLNDFDGATVLLDEMIAIPELTSTGIQRLIVKKVYVLVGAGQQDAALKLLDQEIKTRAENLLLVVAKGELLDSMGDFAGAIAAYDASMTAASSQSDLLIELIGAKADALVEMGKVDEGLLVLEEFINNQSMPADLRSEALLQKSMIYRERDQKTSALRSESKALEVLETQDEKAQIQKLIEQIKAKIIAIQK